MSQQNNYTGSETQPLSVKLDADTAERLKDLGRSPAAICLRDFLDMKLAKARQENDSLEGIYLTRNQGRALMLVELKKVLGMD